MAQVVVMPQLGNTVESCLVTKWLVDVGDTVDTATPLCEIETDKSSMEVPAGVAGTVLALLADEGDDIPVKQPLAVVGEPGEDISGLMPSKPDAAVRPDPDEPAATQPAQPATVPTQTPTPTPDLSATTNGASPSATARCRASGDDCGRERHWPAGPCH